MVDQERAKLRRQVGIDTTCGALGKAIRELVPRVAVVSSNMLEAHGRIDASNEQERRCKLNQITVTAIAPERVNRTGGKQGVRADGNSARWAEDNHPKQGPQHGGKLHRVAVCCGVLRDHSARA